MAFLVGYTSILDLNTMAIKAVALYLKLLAKS